MGRHSKRRAQLANAREKQMNRPRRENSSLNPLAFVLSILFEGAAFVEIERLFSWHNITTPGRSTYYRYLPQVEQAIEQLAEESCRLNWVLMDPSSIIAFDGSWSQRRNALHHVVDFIDCKRKKVVFFSFKEKDNHKLKGNYAGSSNGMELAGIKDFVDFAHFDSRIVGYCHDRDAKSSKFLKECGWNIPELIDKNHMSKSFDRIFAEINTANDNALYGLHGRLRSYLNILYYLDEDVETKKMHWQNALRHYTGNHEKCLHDKIQFDDNDDEDDNEKKKTKRKSFTWKNKHNPQAVNALKELLKKTSFLFDKVGLSTSTQLCECLHSLKARLASKQINWQSSWRARVCAAILDINEGYGWRLKLYERLKLPELNPDCYNTLLKYVTASSKAKKEYQDPEFRRMKNQIRKERRSRNKKKNEGEELYEGLPYEEMKQKISNTTPTNRPGRPRSNSRGRPKKDSVVPPDTIPFHIPISYTDPSTFLETLAIRIPLQLIDPKTLPIVKASEELDNNKLKQILDEEDELDRQFPGRIRDVFPKSLPQKLLDSLERAILPEPGPLYGLDPNIKFESDSDFYDDYYSDESYESLSDAMVEMPLYSSSEEEIYEEDEIE